MSLPLTTAKATKSMPMGKGTYGSKKGRPAKKKGAKKELPAFLQKKGAAKPAAKGAKAPTKGKKALSPAMAKKAAAMKAKSKKK